MSANYRIQKWIWFNGKLTSTEKHVANAILWHRDADGKRSACWPGQERLALMTGLKERAIRNAIRSMEHKGVLTVKRTAGKGNVYYFNCADALAFDADDATSHALLVN